jgi:chemotaxis protein methyltransferase CheR
MNADDFARFTSWLQSHTAISLDPGKEYLVQARLNPVATRHGLAGVADVIAKLHQPRPGNLPAEVIEAMVTTETSFFRDIHPFDALRHHVLPELIALRAPSKSLAIWCGAASSGQEPYSIAILLREYFPQLADWTIHFQATDISTTMLDRCRTGDYSQLEVNRGLPAPLLIKYFQQHGNRWRIREELRQMIDFKPLNLAGDWPLMRRFDLVFLRNVMIYFDVPTKRSILQRIESRLAPDGYLLLGGAETTLNLSTAYRRIEQLKLGFYQLTRN